jgi:hypothetical protein
VKTKSKNVIEQEGNEGVVEKVKKSEEELTKL